MNNESLQHYTPGNSLLKKIDSLVYYYWFPNFPSEVKKDALPLPLEFILEKIVQAPR